MNWTPVVPGAQAPARNAAQHARRILNASCKPASALTAGDVMNRDPVVVPRHVTVREAVRLLHRVRAARGAGAEQ